MAISAREIKSIEKSINEENKTLKFKVSYIVYSVVLMTMTVVNYLSNFRLLTNTTFIFGLLFLVNYFLSLNLKIGLKVSQIIFPIELLILFGIFTVYGEPQGFPVLWAIVIPATAYSLYGRNYGSLISLAEIFVLVFFFWIPIGKDILKYDYTKTFMNRFPILYMVFSLFGSIFESIKEYTFSELRKAREQYQILLYTDQLTGLGNEAAYFRMVDNVDENSKYVVIVMDVNGVKVTNDKYGHRFGCKLIVEAGHVLGELYGTDKTFHIGGDEFVAILKADEIETLDEKLKMMDEKLEYTEIIHEGIPIYLSLAKGVAFHEEGEKYSNTFQRADKTMYENKRAIKEKHNIPSR